jgi:hypothetical protein
MNNYDTFVSAYMTDIKKLCERMFGNYDNELSKYATSFISSLKQEINENIALLKSGQIKEKEFLSLMEMTEGGVEFSLLTASGIAMTKAEHFRKELLNIISSNAIKYLL